MINLITWLIFGHIHHWKEDSRRGISRIRDDTSCGIVVYCTCTKCGKPRNFVLTIG